MLSRARPVVRRWWLSQSRWRHARDAFGWASVLLGVLALVAANVSVSWQPAIVVAAFSPYLSAQSLIGGALLALRRCWLGLLLPGIVVAGTLIRMAPLFTQAKGPQGATVTMMQANLRVGAADPVALTHRVIADNVAVLTVDELTPAEFTRLQAAGIDKFLPYHVVAPHGGGAGTGIWSRYPISGRAFHDEFSFEGLSAQIAIPGAEPVSVWAVHLLPPWPYPSRTWVSEMTRLHQLLGQETKTHHTVIVSGDFNASLDNRQFRQLLGSTFSDAAERTGAGLQFTYPTDRPFPPLLALDHVLAHNADPVSVRSVPLPGSDHRGLVTQLTLRSVVDPWREVGEKPLVSGAC